MIPLHRQRADALLASAGLDAIIATSATNVGYLTGYFLSLDPVFKRYMLDPGSSSDAAFPTFAVLPVAGVSALVVNAAFAANAVLPASGDLYPYGDLGASQLEGALLDTADVKLWDALIAARGRTAVEALVDLLESRNLADARVGIELESVSADVQEHLERALPRAVIRDCTSLFRVLRAVKTPAEIDALARAAAVSLSAASEAVELAKPGVAVRELVDQYRASLSRSGADLDHFLVGRNGLGLTSDPGYALVENEATLVDFGCVLDHYFSDAAWTISLEEPSPRVVTWVHALRDAVDAGAQALRPGTPGSGVSAAMAHELAARRLTGHTLPHGHGLGLEVRDYPILVPPNGRRIRDESIDRPSDMELEPGMVLSLEVSVHLPGLGSLVDERSFVIEGTMARALVAAWPDVPAGAHRAGVMPGQI